MYFSPSKRRAVLERLPPNEIWLLMLPLASETEILNRCFIKIRKGRSLSHAGLSLGSPSHFTEDWIPQEEMLILLIDMKVFFPSIISSDGMRKDWQYFLTRNFLAFHQLSHICREFLFLFLGGLRAVSCVCMLLQWVKLLNKSSRMHNQMDGTWPDWIRAKIPFLGVSVDKGLSSPLGGNTYFLRN